MKKNHLQQILLAFLCYGVFIFFEGFQFGLGDFAETLPYARKLLDGNSYPLDFYIQHISDQFPNERFFYSFIISCFLSHAETIHLCLHIFFGILFFYSWVGIAEIYLRSIAARLLFVFAIAIFLHGVNLGGNELIYNYAMPSMIAKSISSFGLLFLFRQKFLWSGILIAIASLFQILVGLQLGVILISLAIILVLKRRLEIRRAFELALPIIGIVGIWAVILFQQSDPITNPEIYFSMVETRISHHFFPGYFSQVNFVIYLIILAGSILFWWKKDREILWFYGIIIAGCILYTANIYSLRQPFILNSQWFKSTIWLEAFASLGLIGYTETRIVKKRKELIFATGLFIAMGFEIFVVKQFPLKFRYFKQFVKQQNYLFPSQLNQSPEIMMAKAIKECIGSEDVLIVPPDVTAIRYFSEANLYIDYKSSFHNYQYMLEAAERRKNVYGLSLSLVRSTDNPMPEMINYYHHLNEKQLIALKEDGVTMMLSYQPFPDQEVIWSDDNYYLQKLQITNSNPD